MLYDTGINVVCLLVSNSVNVNIPDIDKMTAMHHAVLNGQVVTIRTLSSNRAEVDMNYSSKQETALYIAVSHAQTEIAKLLLVNGADVEALTSDGCTPLHCVANAKILLEEYDFTINSRTTLDLRELGIVLYPTSSKNTIQILEYKSEATVRHFTEYSADVHARMTPLHNTAFSTYMDYHNLCIFLIDKGANNYS